MGNEVAISVKDLSKKFRRYNSVAEGIKEVLHPLRKKYHKEFWALKEVSFEVKKGETVGLIGRNGSGKSTLLQLICGVLQPTSGTVKVNGRVAALLELGAGFSPEFTGRENVYMNGALMGLTKEEIDGKFASIVDFADIGDFIDQPVKTYSSGMYVRLAFSVAINVDPDILVVDEALAVGDEAFQRKCYAKIRSFAELGKTILFVTHSGSTVVELCDKSLLFDSGELILEGAPKLAISLYHKLLYSKTADFAKVRGEIAAINRDRGFKDRYFASGELSEDSGGPVQEGLSGGVSNSQKPYYVSSLVPLSTQEYKTSDVDITDIQIKTQSAEKVNMLVMNENYVYSYRVIFRKDADNAFFGMAIKTAKGVDLSWALPLKHRYVRGIKAGQEFLVEWPFRCSLLPGTYYTNASVVSDAASQDLFLCRITDACMFCVQDMPDQGYGGIVHFDQYAKITPVSS